MCSLEIIEHCVLTEDDLNLIIKIKSRAWNYSFEQHKNWIIDNISDDDIHLILYEGTDAVAYMNLVNVKAIVNHVQIPCWGVGNVCSLYQGKGYGRKLVKSADEYIAGSGKAGLLFCKANLVSFYLQDGWQAIPKDSLDLNFDNTTVHVMVYNYNSCIDKLIYKDKNF